MAPSFRDIPFRRPSRALAGALAPVGTARPLIALAFAALALSGCGMNAYNAGLYEGAGRVDGPGGGPGGGNPNCDDADADGVCDEDDLCPDFDDGDDTDGDGVPAGCDPCPLDVDDDSDGDSVCDSDDLCPGFDDSADADDDGLPNQCDVCPSDPLNDGDNDGLCDGGDPCPGDSQNDCPWTVDLWLQVDIWPEEATWQLRYGDGTSIDSGGFNTDNQVVQRSYDIPWGSYICLSVADTYGDGGIAGELTVVASGADISWTKDDYTSAKSYCIDVL